MGLITRERLRIPPTELGSLNVWEIIRFLSNLTVKDVMVKCKDVISIRMPNKKGELAKVTSAIAAQGWGIHASGGVPTPKQTDSWDCVLKVRDVPKDDLVAVLERVDGQQVLDVREC